MAMAMPVKQWTAKEVRTLIADEPLVTPRYELVDGELLVTPSPGPPHQEAVALLLVALRGYLAAERFGHALGSPSDIEVEEESITQPDVYVLPRAEWVRILADGFPARELLLAIEVVSPTSGRYDRVKKRALYQRRVPEYWIVDLDARLVERWRRGEERPEILLDFIDWTPSGARDAFRLDLPSFFADVFGQR